MSHVSECADKKVSIFVVSCIMSIVLERRFFCFWFWYFRIRQLSKCFVSFSCSTALTTLKKPLVAIFSKICPNVAWFITIFSVIFMFIDLKRSIGGYFLEIGLNLPGLEQFNSIFLWFRAILCASSAISKQNFSKLGFYSILYRDWVMIVCILRCFSPIGQWSFVFFGSNHQFRGLKW